MLFNSLQYFIFLPIVFLIYWRYNNKRFQNIFLLFASYIFYGYWSYKFLALLILSTLLDYFIGFQVNNSNKSKSKLFLYFSIFSNLGILSIFKYYNFFASELNIFFLKFGVNLNPIILRFV